jgi:hypothetical protein
MSTDELRILKKATCPTLSGKSKLTYMIGCDDNSEVFLRVYSNDGGGYFSTEWVALKDIQQALPKCPDDVTSVALYGLFKGKSANTPAFLLAVLKAEKLIQPIKGKQRKHELCDPADFQDRIDKLMSADSKPKTTRKKAAVKKKATPARARKR